MEPPGLAFSLWIFAFLSVPAAGYPNGKVREACSSMMPCHGHSPQPSPKHTISVNETEFRPGDHIKGIVSSIAAVVKYGGQRKCFVLPHTPLL